MQSSLWNGPVGQAWADEQALLDHLLEPFLDILVAALGETQAVLDVGCGTGATTLAVARTRRCVGLDVSQPMLELARARAAQEGSAAEFILADAETYPFEAGSFDLLLSRFGVMFFQDPTAAFANLRRAASDRLKFVAWRSPEENLFLTTAERAARPFLPDLPARCADAPGPFGLCSAERTRGILQASGWADVEIEPLDVPCALSWQAVERYCARIGPLGQVLPQLDPDTGSRVLEAVRAAYAPFRQGQQVRFTAAAWLVSARESGRGT